MKRLVVFTLVVVLTLSLPISAVSIKDVPNDHWAYKSVVKLVNSGLISLYDDGTFRGREAVTRYELAEFVARILENVDSGDANASSEDMDLLRRLSIEFQEELVDLAVQGDAFKEQIKKLQQKNIIQDEFISEIKDVDIANLSDKVDNVEQDVSKIIENIFKIKKLEEEIAALKEENIPTLEQNIADTNARLDALEEHINSGLEQNLQDQLTINQLRIDSLQEEVNELKENLELKNNELQSLEAKKNNDQTYLYGIAGVALLLVLLSN